MPTREKLILTRRDLYDMVWSRPATQVAEELGMSDVALAKWCRKMSIPKPGVGYWQKKAAKKKPRKPRLRNPDREDTLEVWVTRYEPGEEPQPEPERVVPDYERFELEPKNAIFVPTRTTRLHPLVAATKRSLRQGRVDQQYGWIMPAERPCLNVRVSHGTLDRAMLLLDTLIRALAKRRLEVKIEQNGYRSQSVVVVCGRSIPFDLFESPTKGEKEDWLSKKLVPGMVPSGKLVLRVHGTWRAKREWRDMKKTTVEDCLNKFIIALHEEVIYREEEEARNERDRIAAHERALRESEERRVREAETAKLAKLEEMASQWRRANQIREFIQAVLAVHGKHERLDGDAELGEYVAWALENADRIDPLTETDTNAGDG